MPIEVFEGVYPCIRMRVPGWVSGFLLGSCAIDTLTGRQRSPNGTSPRFASKTAPDTDDNRILEVLLAGQGDVLISGDRNLLRLHPFEGLPIVMPAEYLARW